MRENALAAALAEARASLAALQRQHEAGQRALADLQVRRQQHPWSIPMAIALSEPRVCDHLLCDKPSVFSWTYHHGVHLLPGATDSRWSL